jgi:hypothetical protein
MIRKRTLAISREITSLMSYQEIQKTSKTTKWSERQINGARDTKWSKRHKIKQHTPNAPRHLSCTKYQPLKVKSYILTSISTFVMSSLIERRLEAKRKQNEPGQTQQRKEPAYLVKVSYLV